MRSASSQCTSLFRRNRDAERYPSAAGLTKNHWAPPFCGHSGGPQRGSVFLHRSNFWRDTRVFKRSQLQFMRVYKLLKIPVLFLLSSKLTVDQSVRSMEVIQKMMWRRLWLGWRQRSALRHWACHFFNTWPYFASYHSLNRLRRLRWLVHCMLQNQENFLFIEAVIWKRTYSFFRTFWIKNKSLPFWIKRASERHLWFWRWKLSWYNEKPTS